MHFFVTDDLDVGGSFIRHSSIMIVTTAKDITSFGINSGGNRSGAKISSEHLIEKHGIERVKGTQ